ncbi:TldD/PmbA family protein [bacterium]|nr:TldD/PmbA family protein [candidate division CSSED10-310 bacterium]
MSIETTMQKLVQQAIKAGAREVECYFRRGDTLQLTQRNGSTAALSQAAETGAALRLGAGGRWVFVHCNDLTPSALQSTLERGITLLRRVEPNGWMLPAKLAPYVNLDIFDTQINTLNLEQRVALLQRMEGYARSFSGSRDDDVRTTYEDVLEEISLANHRGQFTTYTATRFTVTIRIEPPFATMTTAGEAMRCRRFFKDLEPIELVGRRAALQASWLQKPVSVPIGIWPVVFDPHDAGPRLFEVALGIDRSGRASLWPGAAGSPLATSGRVGMQAASSLVTVVDDATMKSGVASRPFDAEGIATNRTIVIEKGMMKTPLTSLSSTRREKEKSTGSAVRITPGHVPKAGPSNCYLSPGTDSAADLISAVTAGLYAVRLHILAIEPVTGRITGHLSGRWIEGGEFTRSVTGAVFSARPEQLLKQIDGVASDLDHERFAGSAAINCPTYRIERLDLQSAAVTTT